ncbi:MAG: hypothetical protein AB7L84_02370 [Acidimicrobiia bacterium]
MGRLPLRDRFYTPQVARAITSPTGWGLGLVLGVVAGLTVSWWLAVPVLLVVWAVRVALAVPRGSRGPRIDPFTVGEPWRQFVQAALKARARAGEAGGATRSSAVQERLAGIVERIDRAVEEVWSLAGRGHELGQARRDLDPSGVRRRLAAAGEASPARAALEAQLASVERIEQVIEDTRQRLEVLEARLDEAAARTVELSVGADDHALGELGSDVEDVVLEMEALRLALEETSGPSDGPTGR